MFHKVLIGSFNNISEVFLDNAQIERRNLSVKDFKAVNRQSLAAIFIEIT